MELCVTKSYFIDVPIIHYGLKTLRLKVAFETASILINGYYSLFKQFLKLSFEGFPVYEIKQGKVTDIVKIVPIVL